MENSGLCSMDREFVIDTIMSRLDGSTLAASACACSDLHDAASDQSLWKKLCNSTWPSTKSQQLLSSSASLNKFYADAFPLILCESESSNSSSAPNYQSASPPSDLASMVDIYYKGKCILSKVLEAIPEQHVDIYNDDDNNKDNDNIDELQQWLLDCPFRLDLLPAYDDETTYTDAANEEEGTTTTQSTWDDSANDCITYLPSSSSTSSSIENGGGGKRGLDLRDNLAEDIRLSWILFNKKTGKAVNLSSWKPRFVQKSWAPDGEYVLHFGSVIPVGNATSASGHKFAECKIVARCQLTKNGGYAKWTEISMRVEDMAGVHLSTAKSLAVLNQALHCPRTINHLAVERGYIRYITYKKEIKRRNDRLEYLVDKLYALAGLTIITTITYGCTMIFH